jgi:Big-like domain-containing protein/WD40 repeat protein
MSMAGRRRLAMVCLAALGGLFLSGCSGPPQIVTLEPANNTSGVAADAPITVSFDHPVQHASVASRFHIDPPLAGCDLAVAFGGLPPAGCRVDWNHESSGFTLRHTAALFASSQRYNLSLDGGITDPSGVSNGLDHHWGFWSGAGPTLRSISPGDGATDVGIESPAVLSFSTPMDVDRTSAAISVVPAAAGTRVVQNKNDPSRFVVVFGALLDPRTSYTITVAATAADTHGAPLGTVSTARFTTGTTVSNRGHALVLARRSGELPSSILLTGTSPQTAGDPVPAATVLAAPRCAADHCGRAAPGAPLEAYIDAALASDGRHVAIITRDLVSAVPQDHLDLLDLGATSLVPRRVAGEAAHPAWSPDGRLLAFSSGAAVELVSADGAATTALPGGGRLVGRPSWSGDGSTLALPVSDAKGAGRVDLADPLLGVRYPVPGLTKAATQPVLSVDGSLLALELTTTTPTQGGTWLVRLRTGDAAPRQLGDTLRPVAFGEGGSLLALQRTSTEDAALVRLSVSGGDADRISTAIDSRGIDSVVAGSGGHILGYVQPDDAGITQAWLENSDGSNTLALTSFSAGGLQAVAVVLPA